ncbi:hypothetical protein J6590_061861 [Homalodisca vitripennis]|nr:hypothetical protein J6590_061861 [Homalodisca vitripennis]
MGFKHSCTFLVRSTLQRVLMLPCYQIYYETTQQVSAGHELLLPPREPLHLDYMMSYSSQADDRSDRESGSTACLSSDISMLSITRSAHSLLQLLEKLHQCTPGYASGSFARRRTTLPHRE